MKTVEEIISVIRKSVLKDGDFPTSAKTISELQRLANDPHSTAQQMTDIILKEPSLGTKILSVVNSAYFRRVKPILTVSEAVVVLGSRQISDICGSLLILSKFSQGSLSNELSKALQKSIMSSLIASSLENGEVNYIASIFRGLGEILVCYYLPEIASKIAKVAELKELDFEGAFKLLFSKDLIDVTLQILADLKLPVIYQQYLKACKLIYEPDASLDTSRRTYLKKAQILESSRVISNSVIENKEIDFDKISEFYGIQDSKLLETALNDAFDGLDQFQDYTQVNLQSLKIKKSKYTKTDEAFYEKNEQLLIPIKEAISRNANTASLLLLATDIFKSSFDRIILYLKVKDLNILRIRIFEGVRPSNLAEFEQLEVSESNILGKALKLGKPLILDSGLFKDSYPAFCIPIGNYDIPVGVLYADKIERLDHVFELSDREKALIHEVHSLINSSLKNEKKTSSY